MKTRRFGQLGDVSALTLGGGGIGKVWGITDRREAVRTMDHAIEAGITLVDVAPGYGTKDAPREAEHVVGEAFRGNVPRGVRIVTKVEIDDGTPRDIRRTVRASLALSLRTMRLERVDVLLHHSCLRPVRIPCIPSTLSLSLFRDVLRGEFEQLRDEGLIGAWGLTATGHPEAVIAAIDEEPRPQVVQTVTNLLDSPGSLWYFGVSERADNPGTRRRAAEAGIGVMGIRAVQAGALTDKFDRQLAPNDLNQRDYERAAGFRVLASRRGESAAFLAYRFALSMDAVDTVVVGVKNRLELAEAVAAEAAGPLSSDELLELHAAVATNPPR